MLASDSRDHVALPGTVVPQAASLWWYHCQSGQCHLPAGTPAGNNLLWKCGGWGSTGSDAARLFWPDAAVGAIALDFMTEL